MLQLQTSISVLLCMCMCQETAAQQYNNGALYTPPTQPAQQTAQQTFQANQGLLPAVASQSYQQPAQFQQPQQQYQAPQYQNQQPPQPQWGGNPMANGAAANGPPQAQWGGNAQGSKQAYGNQAPMTNWDKLEDDLEEELPQTDEGIFGLFIMLWVMLCICGCVYNKNNGERGMDVVPGCTIIYKIDDTLFDGKVTGIHRYGTVQSTPIDIGKYVGAFSNTSTTTPQTYDPIRGGTISTGPTKQITQDNYNSAVQDV